MPKMAQQRRRTLREHKQSKAKANQHHENFYFVIWSVALLLFPFPSCARTWAKGVGEGERRTMNGKRRGVAAERSRRGCGCGGGGGGGGGR